MINLEEELDKMNYHLYKILNKIADIQIDLKTKQLDELEIEIASKNELIENMENNKEGI